MPTVFARTPQESLADYTVRSLTAFLSNLSNQPALLLEIAIRGEADWFRYARKAWKGLPVDYDVLRAVFAKIQVMADQHLIRCQVESKRLRDKAITDAANWLEAKQNERDHEQDLFDAAEEPRPGLRMNELIEKLPEQPVAR